MNDLGLVEMTYSEAMNEDGGILPVIGLCILAASAGTWFWRGFAVGASCGAAGAAAALA
ncbi:MAG: hypothetical protein ACK5BJ_18360 [Bacteroidota bacterium]|nr:hypothetical protein [Cytophagales bacterium]